MDPFVRLVQARNGLLMHQHRLATYRKFSPHWEKHQIPHVLAALDEVMTAQIYAHRHLTNALNPWPEKVITITQEK